MYRILQRHRAVSLPQHGFLVQTYIGDRSNAEITHSTLIFKALTQNHGASVSAVQVRPRLLILAPIESAYVTIPITAS